MLNQARLFTRLTLAVISPAIPEFAKTASSPRYAPSPKRSRRESSSLFKRGSGRSSIVRVRILSLEGRLDGLPLRVSNEESPRPRVARAQEAI